MTAYLLFNGLLAHYLTYLDKDLSYINRYFDIQFILNYKEKYFVWYDSLIKDYAFQATEIAI